MDETLREKLLTAVHEVAIRRYKEYANEVLPLGDEFIPFRAGYQNAIIDILSGVFGREAVTP